MALTLYTTIPKDSNLVWLCLGQECSLLCMTDLVLEAASTALEADSKSKAFLAASKAFLAAPLIFDAAILEADSESFLTAS